MPLSIITRWPILFSVSKSLSFIRFEEQAEAAFVAYLKANYSDDFPYNANNMIFCTGKTGSSASVQDLISNQQALESRNGWTADQKSDKNTVVQTHFNYSCEKD